jgi:hypothetical protein
MSKILPRVFSSITKGVDTRITLIQAFSLSVPATLITIPFFYYLLYVVPQNGRPDDTSLGLLFTQLFLLFIVCLLSAIIGFSFSNKLNLKGFGELRELINSLPTIIIVSIILLTFSYLLFDRYFYTISPSSYPDSIIYLITLPLKGALTEEVILRLCLVTLVIGITKSRAGAVFLVSVIASLFSLKYFSYIGIESGLNRLLITQLCLSFIVNLILGYLYVTRGLLSSMMLKALLGLKYALVAATF